MMTPWMKELPDGRHAVYLDNLLLNSYNSCEQYFYYRHVRNRVMKGTGFGQTAASKLGIWWSSTMELFYKHLMEYQHKKKLEPSESTIVDNAGVAWGSHDMEGEFKTIFTGAYDRFRGTEGAIQMAVEYFRHYAEYDIKNWKIIAMELGFGYGNEVFLGSTGDIDVYWCGRPDLTVFEEDTHNLVSVDHKSKDFLKSNFIELWKPHPQTAGYIYALRCMAESLGYKDLSIDRCVINGAARYVAIKPTTKRTPRFNRIRPTYSVEELLEWKDRTVRKAQMLFESYRDNIWMWRESACHLYGGCPYRGVDNVTPSAREIVLKSSYVEIEPWKPYIKTDTTEEEEAIA